MRIVSLLPSATEIVAAVGCGDQLVGRSHECDWPRGVERLPAVCAPKLAVDGSSREIDRDVKRLVAEGLSVYRVEAERLRALAPDVIITQTQCEVCAVSEADVLTATCDWAPGVRIVALAPNRLADVWRDIERVATELDVAERGVAVADELRGRLERLAARTRPLAVRPSVACIEWLEPLMAAGNWVPELVEISGGRNLFGAAGEHSPWLAWEALREADPEVIVAMPCGFDLARTRAEMPALERLPGWYGLRAVRTGRVYVVDGHQFFNRPGPRLVESAEILAELLHPHALAFGHEGAGWAPYRATVPA